MKKGSSRYAGLADRIVELRKSGKSCKAVASELGVPLHCIYRAMTCAGIGRTIWAKHGDRPDEEGTTPIRRALALYGSVYIETGCNDGYIVTVGDKHTGSEKNTPSRAVLSALQAAGRKEKNGK